MLQFCEFGSGTLHPALSERTAGTDTIRVLWCKCLQPLALLMVFGLLWLLAYSGLELRRAPRLLMSDRETAITVVREACLHPRPGVPHVREGGHLISGQMAKAFSSA